MIEIGIIGAAGYTAGELIRILLNHPQANIVFAHSNSQAGKAVCEIHRDLTGSTALTFTNTLVQDIDVLFLCSGHGKSRAFLEENKLSDQLKIIDLSHDFRLTDSAEGFVYGLPELQKENIQKADRIANPGCFATAIQLALLPMAIEQQLNDSVHIHGITGSTGAGQQATATTHFSWRDNNVSIYKAFGHQHLAEIKESILKCQPGCTSELNFLPVRGNFSRGIFVSAYLTTDMEASIVQQLYQDYYARHPFVHIVNDTLHLKQVLNTNKCFLQVQKIDDKLLITCVIDNLIKGASGQAVQNMNLMFGLEETAGLQLKSSAF